MKHDSHFTFQRLQFKSIDKIKLFCKLFGEMEIEFWIRVCKITLIDCFICPDITEEELATLTTPAEVDVLSIIRKL